MVKNGAPFPGRAQIIACTLVVILVTLIGQGVTLQPLMRRLGLSDADPTEAEVRRAREVMLSAGIAPSPLPFARRHVGSARVAAG